MIVLGLILIIVAAAAVLFAVIATGTLTASPLSAVGITVSVTPLTMFIAGALALLLVVLGLALIGRGTKRSVHTRRELRHLRKERANQPAAAGAGAGGTTPTDDGERGAPCSRPGPGGPRRRPRPGATRHRRRRTREPAAGQRVPPSSPLSSLDEPAPRPPALTRHGSDPA